MSIVLEPLGSEPLPLEAWGEPLDDVFGEGLSVDERLVVSPCEGALRDRRAKEGEYICAGDVVASVPEFVHASNFRPIEIASSPFGAIERMSASGSGSGAESMAFKRV